MLKKLILMSLLLSSFTLFAFEETVKFDIQTKKILEEDNLSIFDWFSSTPPAPKDEFGEYIKSARENSYQYFHGNCSAGEIACTTVRVKNLSLSPGLEFQMVIVSFYDGENYYEGLSDACYSNTDYQLNEETWESMKNNAIIMAWIAYDMNHR